MSGSIEYLGVYILDFFLLINIVYFELNLIMLRKTEHFISMLLNLITIDVSDP